MLGSSSNFKRLIMNKIKKDPREHFVIYKSFHESIQELEEKDQLQMYIALCNYGLNHIEPDFKGYCKAIFIGWKPQIDANYKKYLNRKDKTKKNKKEQNETNVNDNVNHNQNDNVNDNQNVEITNEKATLFKVAVHELLKEKYSYYQIRKFVDFCNEETPEGLLRYEEINDIEYSAKNYFENGE